MMIFIYGKENIQGIYFDIESIFVILYLRLVMSQFQAHASEQNTRTNLKTFSGIIPGMGTELFKRY